MASDTPTRQPRNVLPDLVIPALALAFTAYYLTTITEVPWLAQASAVTVSCLLILAIAAYAVRTASRIAHGSETIRLPELTLVSMVTVRRFALLTLAVAYVLLIGNLGFTLTTTVFIFLAIIVLSSAANWRRAALMSVGCSAAGYLVFIYFFKTRFPMGFIEKTLQGLF